MNLLFSGNDNVFDGILTCLLSVFKRTEVKEPFVIYILTMDVSRIKPEYIAIKDERIAFLEEIAKEYNSDNKIVKIDVTDIYEKEFANSPNEQCYCSPYTLLRLFIDKIPQITGKILYLTSSRDYAIEAFNVHAYNYLLKPVQKEEKQHTHADGSKSRQHPAYISFIFGFNHGFRLYSLVGLAFSIAHQISLCIKFL